MLLGVLILGLLAWMHFPLLAHKYDESMYATTAKPLARPMVTIARPLANPRAQALGQYDWAGMNELFSEVMDIPTQQPKSRYKKQ